MRYRWGRSDAMDETGRMLLLAFDDDVDEEDWDEDDDWDDDDDEDEDDWDDDDDDWDEWDDDDDEVEMGRRGGRTTWN